MSDDLTTTPGSTLTVDLTTRAGCIQHGLSGKKAMLDSARAWVTHHGPIEEWVDEMGLGKSTGYRYRASLLKEGKFKYLAPKEEVSERTKYYRKAEERLQNSLSEKSAVPQPSPLAPLDPAFNEELAPLVPSTTEMGRAIEAHLAATDDMTDQELHIARLEWERDIEHAGVETILRGYGKWDPKTGFFPDPSITLIEKHLDNLNLEELERLQANITRRINRGTSIDV